MIGFVKGIIDSFDRPFVIIDVSGVGYRILVSDNVFSKLTENQKIKLYTFTYVREDELALFGFLEQEDLKLFDSLLTVSGVGPKTAMSIFSAGTRDQILEAIVKADVSFFSSVPRLGSKNAQKIIIELKNKLGGVGSLDLSGKDSLQNNEVIQALRTFGFSQTEAQRALREIKEKDLTTEEKIRKALKVLGR